MTVGIDTGKLTKLVTIRRRDLTGRDASGDIVETVAKGVERWAWVRPLTGREFAEQAQMKSEATHIVTLHWEPDLVGPDDYLELDGRVLEVVDVANTDEADVELVLRCLERRT